MADINDPAAFIEENKVAGDFIAPNTSDEAKRAILAARALMYSNDGQIVMQAIEGANSLVDGSAPIIAMVINSVEDKLGQLADDDLPDVAFHLAGTIVEIARDMGDPEALEQDGRYAAEEITDAVMDILGGEMSDEAPPQMDAQMAPQAPVGAQPLIPGV